MKTMKLLDDWKYITAMFRYCKVFKKSLNTLKHGGNYIYLLLLQFVNWALFTYGFRMIFTLSCDFK